MRKGCLPDYLFHATPAVALGKDITVLSAVNTKVAAEMNDSWNTFFNNSQKGAFNMSIDFAHSLNTILKSTSEFTKLG